MRILIVSLLFTASLGSANMAEGQKDYYCQGTEGGIWAFYASGNGEPNYKVGYTSELGETYSGAATMSPYAALASRFAGKMDIKIKNSETNKVENLTCQVPKLKDRARWWYCKRAWGRRFVILCKNIS